jgi:hypothetical protein
MVPLEPLEPKEYLFDVCAKDLLFKYNYHILISEVENLDWDKPTLTEIRSTL